MEATRTLDQETIACAQKNLDGALAANDALRERVGRLEEALEGFATLKPRSNLGGWFYAFEDMEEPLRLARDLLFTAAMRERGIPSRADAIEAALRAFLDWASKQCPCANEEPNPCPLCGASVENLEGCKAIDAKFPADILSKARSALESVEALSVLRTEGGV